MPRSFRSRARGGASLALAVIMAGCGEAPGLSPTAATPGFSAGTIEFAPAGAIVGTSVAFSSQSAFDPAGGPLAFTWDFGDGTSAAGEAVTHAYTSSGDFNLTVTATNGEGSSTTATAIVPVRSLTARWSGTMPDLTPSPGRPDELSITQTGLDLAGTYLDGSGQQGSIAGTISATGTVTLVVTSAARPPLTFTGAAGPNVETLVGTTDRWTLARQ